MMSQSLRSLAGDKFKLSDVITALHAPLEPEKLVLDQYTFLPYARTGIAAALDVPFAWTLPARTQVELRVPVMDDRGSLDAEMTVRVFGPADVIEIDTRQIIRTYPKADVNNAEVDDLVHVEFDRPDLPWLFTPSGPDLPGRLVPWITLVVAERRFLDWGDSQGSVRLARIRRDQLQPLHDAWAWAHAQVMGARGAPPGTPIMPDSPPTLERRLSESNAAHNLSRLVCPRRLDDHTHYVACVVPTFLSGVQAGLGVTPVSSLAPAWGTADNFAGGDPLDMVALPVYYSWSFGTAESGNFESLARKLRPAIAPPGVGRRRVDATRAWPGLDLERDDPGAEILITGPVVSPQLPESEPSEHWPTESQQHWLPAVTATLTDKLNQPDRQAHATEPELPLIGPPLYGASHSRQTRIEVEEPAASAQPAWFRELNLDPRHRIVAGVGTHVIQKDQEELMLAAWNQVIGIEESNRALRLAQLARHVGRSLHRRHLARFSDASVVSITERVHPKLRDVETHSIWSSIRASSLPLTVTTGAFRRLTRPRGPMIKSAIRSRLERKAAVDKLTVPTDRLTANWVLDYQSPDGITGLSDIAARELTADLAERVSPGNDAATLLSRWRRDLARPSAPDQLTRQALEDPAIEERVDFTTSLLASLADRLLGTMPSQQDMESDPELTLTGAGRAPLLRIFDEIARSAHHSEIPVRPADVERLQLEPVGETDDRRRVLVTSESVRALGIQALEIADLQQLEVPLGDLELEARKLRELASRILRTDRNVMVTALRDVAGKVILDDAYAEPGRKRVNSQALEIVAKLDPAITVPARVLGRLQSGSGRYPAWLRSDWFANGRVEPVMAHPRFKYPMYEPLHRYDREWMVPGLGLIERPDMATLLETNNRFIEAYLTGLNHEMARELLWREFPTDQRGTCFSSFWTGSPELVADMHEPAWESGSLGTHVDKAFDGQIVFLVRGDLIRRYPGVVAHTAREQRTDASGVPVFEALSPVRTLFHVFLPPNVLLVGFAMTRARITSSGEKWWFTLSENPSEPRFGLDPSRSDPLATRDNLVWDDFGVSNPGSFLDASAHSGLVLDSVRWGTSSASVAYLLFQLPARAVFLASKMVAGAIR